MVIVQTDSFHLKKEPSDSDYGAPRNTNLKFWFMQLRWSKTFKSRIEIQTYNPIDLAI